MNATETPMPTSVRPAAAISHDRREREQRASPTPGDQRSGAQDAPRAERVGEHADRDLQQRVDVEIRRRERAEHRAVDRERARRARRRSPRAPCDGRTTARSSRARCRRRRGARGRNARRCGADAGMRHCTGIRSDAACASDHAIAASRDAINRPPWPTRDLRDFLAQLERRGELKRVARRSIRSSR